MSVVIGSRQGDGRPISRSRGVVVGQRCTIASHANGHIQGHISGRGGRGSNGEGLAVALTDAGGGGRDGDLRIRQIINRGGGGGSRQSRILRVADGEGEGLAIVSGGVGVGYHTHFLTGRPSRKGHRASVGGVVIANPCRCRAVAGGVIHADISA